MLHRTVRLGPTAPPVAGGPFAPEAHSHPHLCAPSEPFRDPGLTAMSFRKAEIAAILTQLGGTAVAPAFRRGPPRRPGLRGGTVAMEPVGQIGGWRVG